MGEPKNKMAQTTTMTKLRGRHYAARAAHFRATANLPNSNSNFNSTRPNNDSDYTSTNSSNNDEVGDGDDREMQIVQDISDRLETGLDEFALQAILIQPNQNQMTRYQ